VNENPWLERRILNYAHQGGSHEGPSSTLFAIDRALRAGAGAIELDVHATKDRQLVVCHDETVDRTTNGRGEICDLSLSELQGLDNACWFIEGSDVSPGQPGDAYVHRGKAPANRSFGIVTLEEVIHTFPGVPINLDIKRSVPEVEAYEELLAKELSRLKRDEDTIVASFNDLALRSFRARRLSPLGTRLHPGSPLQAGPGHPGQSAHDARSTRHPERP
jgi:glycerophosphoryl diester phosphodiesterase